MAVEYLEGPPHPPVRCLHPDSPKADTETTVVDVDSTSADNSWATYQFEFSASASYDGSVTGISARHLHPLLPQLLLDEGHTYHVLIAPLPTRGTLGSPRDCYANLPCLPISSPLFWI